MTKSKDIAYEGIIIKWGDHRRDKDHLSGAILGGSFQGKLTIAVEMLEKRGVIRKTKSENQLFYELSVDLFRRWWSIEHSDLNNELDKLIEG